MPSRLSGNGHNFIMVRIFKFFFGVIARPELSQPHTQPSRRAARSVGLSIFDKQCLATQRSYIHKLKQSGNCNDNVRDGIALATSQFQS